MENSYIIWKKFILPTYITLYPKKIPFYKINFPNFPQKKSFKKKKISSILNIINTYIRSFSLKLHIKKIQKIKPSTISTRKIHHQNSSQNIKKKQPPNPKSTHVDFESFNAPTGGCTFCECTNPHGVAGGVATHPRTNRAKLHPPHYPISARRGWSWMHNSPACSAARITSHKTNYCIKCVSQLFRMTDVSGAVCCFGNFPVRIFSGWLIGFLTR